MARFERRALSSETVPFALRIDKFSLVVRRGYYEGPAFEGGRTGNRWRLVVYASEGREYEDLVDIHLRREGYDAGDQCVEVRVTVDDYFGFSSLSEKDQFCFSRDREAHRVMSVPGRIMSEFNRLRYLPNDTLTIRGEMTVYEERKMPFDKESDFDNSQDHSAQARFAFAWWILRHVFLTVAACLYNAVVSVRYLFSNALVPLLKNIVLPYAYSLLLMLLRLIKEKALKKLGRKSEERHRPRSSGNELVPVIDAGNGQIGNYRSGGRNYDKNWKHGQTMIYVVDSKHLNELKNRFYRQ